MKTRRTYGTGSLFKRGNCWYVQLRDPSGRMVQRSLRDPVTNQKPKTKAHAERLASITASEISRGIKLQKTTVTYLASLDKAYRESFSDRWSEKKSNARKKVMQRFFDWFDTIEKVSHEELGKYVKNRLDMPVGEKKKKFVTNSTVNRELAELRRLLNWSAQTGRIDKNPMFGFKLLKEPNHRERILSKDEISRLLTALNQENFSHIRPIVKIALYCGLRYGEIVSLKWSDLNASRQEFDLLKTKSGKRRQVPIPPNLFNEIQSLPRESEYLFPSLSLIPKKDKETEQVVIEKVIDPNKHITEIKRSFRALLTTAKIDGFKFHDLRHCCASVMLNNGADIKTVQEILCHASIITTQRYLTSLEEAKKTAVRNIESILNSKHEDSE